MKRKRYPYLSEVRQKSTTQFEIAATLKQIKAEKPRASGLIVACSPENSIATTSPLAILS